MLESDFLDLVKSELISKDDAILIEDLDLICKYIVLRFLKVQANALCLPQEQVVDKLTQYVREIYPFLVVFIKAVNFPKLV